MVCVVVFVGGGGGGGVGLLFFDVLFFYKPPILYIHACICTEFADFLFVCMQIIVYMRCLQ